MTAIEEIETYLARTEVWTAWDQVLRSHPMRPITTSEWARWWATAHVEDPRLTWTKAPGAELCACCSWWDPPFNELTPRELAEYIESQAHHVLDEIVSAVAAARERHDPARPDELGISWGARYFYAIARTLGWETAQAELGTPEWEER